jgi:predicted nucleotidyltransferase
MKPSAILDAHRAVVRALVERHHTRNPRVFGSVLDRRDRDDSDLDLLVDPTSRTTLLDIGALRHDLSVALGVRVDVVTPDALPESFRADVIARALAV